MKPISKGLASFFKMENINIQIKVQCTLERAWQLWSSPEGLSSFFGVANFFELKLGGPFEIYFSLKPAEGERGSENCKVLSFIPYKMLSFTWNAPPSIPLARSSSHKTFVVLFFEPKGEDECELTLYHEGWTEEGPEWEATNDYFKQAWPIVLDNFKTVAETKS